MSPNLIIITESFVNLMKMNEPSKTTRISSDNIVFLKIILFS